MLTAWLKEHVSGKADPDRYKQSVRHLLRYFERERIAGRIKGSGVMLGEVNRRFVDGFIAFRKIEGVGGHTISRDLAALRGALNHAWKHERIVSVPFVREVNAADKSGPREKILTIEHVAGLLEAAARADDRQHVLLYTLIQLSTCGRTNAILALDAETQIRDGLIHFLPPGEKQTSKRRSIVPIAPTLAPWLVGLSGKVIRYRVPVAAKKRVEGGPTHYEREVADIGKAFTGCLVDAAERGATGIETRATPNTLRHTVITEMHRRGVPEAQIETASGHRGEGTNKRNYRHLRPNYLSDMIDGVEGYWDDMRKLTTVHLRTQVAPNVIDFGTAKRAPR